VRDALAVVAHEVAGAQALDTFAVVGIEQVIEGAAIAGAVDGVAGSDRADQVQDATVRSVQLEDLVHRALAGRDADDELAN
jgi:hypothetical protein